MNSSQFVIRSSEVEFFTPTPMTLLSFSLSFETSGEKSESPEQITKVVMCVDDHADVGGVLPRVVALRDVDELDRRFVELALVFRVPGPVRIRLLVDDA